MTVSVTGVATDAHSALKESLDRQRGDFSPHSAYGIVESLRDQGYIIVPEKLWNRAMRRYDTPNKMVNFLTKDDD